MKNLSKLILLCLLIGMILFIGSCSGEEHIENVEVTIEDLGALDYTIRARLIVAIKRMRKNV